MIMKRTVHLSNRTLMMIMICYVGIALFQSCNTKSKENSSTGDAGAQLEKLTDDFSQEEFFEDGDVDYSEGLNPVNDDEGEDNMAESSPSEPSQLSSQVDYTSTSKSVQTPTSTAGKYMIVVGNYLVESNADAMVTRLKSSGYGTAETVIFDLSQYHTVIVGRYDQRAAADRVAQKLRNEGYDNYVLGGK